MTEKFKNLSDRQIYFILAGIIACQIIIMALTFGIAKKGWYCDEMYSYGTANSLGAGVPLAENDEWKYTDRWFSGALFKNYLTVSQDEIIRYDHINTMLKSDSHPPLHYYLLHLVSSLTPGKFAKWGGFMINAFAFAVIQIYLYRIVAELSHKRYTALAACMFFGLTAGAMNIVVFIRMYALLTAFSMMFTYYSIRIFCTRDNSRECRRNILSAAVSLYLGAMTQYLIVIYAAVLTLCFCIYYLFSKRIKLMLGYGLSMAAAVALMAASFPVLVTQLNNSQQAVNGAEKYPFLYELRLSVHLCMNELFGINTPVNPTMIPFWTGVGITAVLIIYLIMCFLFRTDKWFQDFRGREHSWVKRLIRYIAGRGFPLFALMLTVAAMLLIISREFKIYYFYPYSDRYLFMLFPLVIAVVMLLLSRVTRRKWIFACLAGVLLIVAVSSGDRIHLHNSGVSGEEPGKVAANADVIFVGSYYASIMLYPADLQDCSSCFVTTVDDYRNDRAALEKIRGDGKPLYLMVDKNIARYSGDAALQGITDYFAKLKLGNKFEEIGKSPNMRLYRLAD